MVLATAVRATTAACDKEGEGMEEAEPGPSGQRASPPPATTGVRSAQIAMDFMLIATRSSLLATVRQIFLSRVFADKICFLQRETSVIDYMTNTDNSISKGFPAFLRMRYSR
jgi:hypothetical protein